MVLLGALIILPLLAGFTVGGDDNIVTIGKDVTLEANSFVTNNVVVIGGSATIRGQVQENVVAVFGNIYLEQGAVVRGDAVAVFGSVIRQGDSQVYGESVSVDIGSLNWRDLRFSGVTRPFQGAWRGSGSIWGVLWVVLLGLIVMWVAPRAVEGVASAATTDPVKAILYGLLSYVALVPLTIVMVISLLGIPLIPFFWLAVAVGRLVGQVALGLVAGRYILRQASSGGHNQAAAAAIGLLALGVITLIPVAGGFASLFYSLLGFGAVVWSRFGRRPVSPVAASQRGTVVVEEGNTNV
jgi:hypothetical protein